MWRIKGGLNVIDFSSSKTKLVQKTQLGTIFFFFACFVVKILQYIIGSAINFSSNKCRFNSKNS